jgi:hypothetical protein
MGNSTYSSKSCRTGTMGGMSGHSTRPSPARATRARRGSRRHGTRRRRSGERGAALVEAAIITPLLLLLIFGVIEFGFLFKDALTLANATRSGARVGSSSANDPLADYNILKAIEPSKSFAKINDIVVYKADGPDGTVPPNCINSGVAGLCNHYTAADLSIDQASFLSPGFFQSQDWPSSARQCSPTSPGGPDYLGVWVNAQHNSTVGFFPSRTLHDYTVMRVEICP